MHSTTLQATILKRDELFQNIFLLRCIFQELQGNFTIECFYSKQSCRMNLLHFDFIILLHSKN